MEIDIGSNIIRDTNGVLNVAGEDQISLEMDPESNQLLLSMDIYDASSVKVAKLKRNAWVFNKDADYEIRTNPHSLQLINRQSSKVVVEVRVAGVSKIEIPHGAFYTSKGKLLEISPQHWKISGITMSGNIIEGCGKAVAIG